MLKYSAIFTQTAVYNVVITIYYSIDGTWVELQNGGVYPQDGLLKAVHRDGTNTVFPANTVTSITFKNC
jgi:hypothetical protein